MTIKVKVINHIIYTHTIQTLPYVSVCASWKHMAHITYHAGVPLAGLYGKGLFQSFSIL